jgi:hypothetical protein
MALIKCRECGNQVSTEAATCPHCGAPQRVVPPQLPPTIVVQHQPPPPQKKGIGFFSGCLIVLLALVTIGIISSAIMQATRESDSSSLASSSSSPAPAQPRDDVELFIAKYGPPDREDSTQHDSPRPPIVTRFLIYDAERVRAVYVPDAKVGTPPPYRRWKLMGFQDSQDNSVIRVADVDERLKNRKRQ